MKTITINDNTYVSRVFSDKIKPHRLKTFVGDVTMTYNSENEETVVVSFFRDFDGTSNLVHKIHLEPYNTVKVKNIFFDHITTSKTEQYNIEFHLTGLHLLKKND